MENADPILVAAAVVVAVIVYLLPAEIAQRRKHHSWRAIFALNLLTGWTGLGWILALVWSLTAVRKAA